MTPYDEALQLIKQGPDTDSGEALAKLILSLYNGRVYRYSFAECVRPLDGKNTDLALRMVTRYCKWGEDHGLRQVAGEIQDMGFGL